MYWQKACVRKAVRKPYRKKNQSAHTDARVRTSVEPSKATPGYKDLKLQSADSSRCNSGRLKSHVKHVVTDSPEQKKRPMRSQTMTHPHQDDSAKVQTALITQKLRVQSSCTLRRHPSSPQQPRTALTPENQQGRIIMFSKYWYFYVKYCFRACLARSTCDRGRIDARMDRIIYSIHRSNRH